MSTGSPRRRPRKSTQEWVTASLTASRIRPTGYRGVFHRAVVWTNRKTHKYFVGTLLLVLSASVVFSDAALWLKDLRLFPLPWTDRAFDLPTLFVTLLVISASTKCELGDFPRLVGSPRASLTSLFLFYVLVPLLAAVVGLFARAILPADVGPQVQVGLTLTAVVPVTMTAAMWVRVNVGDLARTVFLLVLTMALAAVSVPAYLGLLPGMVGRQVDFPAAVIVQLLVVAVTIPLLVGLCLRRLLPWWVDRWDPVFSLCGTLGLWGAVMTTAASSVPSLVAEGGTVLPKLVVLTVGLNVAAYWTGVLAARHLGLTYEDGVSVIFGAGMRSNGTSLMVGMKSFPTLPFVTVPAAIYIISQHLLAAYLTRRLWDADSGILRQSVATGLQALERRLDRLMPESAADPGTALLVAMVEDADGQGPTSIHNVARAIRRKLRRQDQVCMLPPDAVAVLLPRTGRREADALCALIASRVISRFPELRIRCEHGHSADYGDAGSLLINTFEAHGQAFGDLGDD